MCLGYLSLQEHVSMATAYPIMWDYACMRQDTCVFRMTISEAPRAPCPILAMVPALCPFCTWFMGAALLSTYPRFMALFISGLMLSPISWIMHKGKGRLIVDASTKLAPDDSGARNDHILPPGKPSQYEENPPVSYGSMLKQHLAHPDEDLLQHTDDIDSAFRWMLYHPELAVVFAYVFQELLIVPIGNIFGS
jgi:hypothetical protein